MEKKKRRAIRTRKKKLHVLNAEKKGTTQTNATKNSQTMVNTSNKLGSNFLIMNDNQHGYSSEEDNTERPYAEYDFTAIQELNEETEESEEDDTKSETAIIKKPTMSQVKNHPGTKVTMMNMKVSLSQKIHQDSKRKSTAYSQHIAFQAIPQQTNCRNSIQHNVLAKLLPT